MRRHSGVGGFCNVNLKIVWEVATVHVPEVSAVLEKFFATRSPSSIAPPQNAGESKTENP
jgi:uncharacterized protein with HEPN domain